MQRDLALVKPTRKYASQVMHYKQEMLANNDSLDGCAGLEDTDSFDEWIDFDNRLKKKYGEGYVPSEVFLAIRKADDKLVGNQAPDVFVITSENKNDLIDNGYALDMTGKSYVKKLSQANKDFLSRDGKLYGQSISSWAAGIAYNKDLLGQVGYDSVPATWDEFLDLCGKLKNKGITPYIESLGDGNDRIPDSFMGAVYAKDGVDVTTLADKTPSTPGANEKDCVKAWMKVHEKGYASRDNVGVSGDDAKTQFANGQVAMYTTGVWDFSAFEGASFDWGFARIPALDKNHEQYSQGSPSPGLTIYSKLKGDKLKAAEKFLDFMVSDWALKQRSKNGDAITVEGFDSDVAKQYKEIYDENVKTGKYFLYTNFYKKPDVLSSANTAEIQQLVQGSISVDQWAKNIDDKMAAAQ